MLGNRRNDICMYKIEIFAQHLLLNTCYFSAGSIFIRKATVEVAMHQPPVFTKIKINCSHELDADSKIRIRLLLYNLHSCQVRKYYLNNVIDIYYQRTAYYFICILNM